MHNWKPGKVQPEVNGDGWTFTLIDPNGAEIGGGINRVFSSALSAKTAMREEVTRRNDKREAMALVGRLEEWATLQDIDHEYCEDMAAAAALIRKLMA